MLTLRGLAMTSVAYITALTIGIFAVTALSSNAAVQYVQIPIPAHKHELVKGNPLERLEGVRKLTQDELVELLRAVGFKGQSLKIAWAVAMRESNGRPIAHNDNVRTGDNSYGIFQVNMIGSLGVDRREKFNLAADTDLFVPVTNAKITFHMTKGGTDWGSWGLGPNAYDGSAEEPSITKWLPLFPKS